MDTNENAVEEQKQNIFLDLDGTLAEYHGWNEGKIGKPIPRMVARLKAWLAHGHKVTIFTARARDESEIVKIKAWLKENDLPEFEITNVKSYKASVFYDDRAVTVIPNSGYTVIETADAMIKKLQAQVASLQREIGGASKVKLYDNLGGEIK